MSNNIDSFDPTHGLRVHRGSVGPRRAAPALPRISDGTNEVAGASELLFTGGTVTEPEDGVAQITLGGGVGSGGSGGSGAMPVQMLNNAGRTLLAGETVVVDSTADRAVTSTTDEGSILIAGVVQEPIAIATVGPVLFNGYAAEAIVTGDVLRGQYAQTSAVAGAAQATDAREAGSFGVFLTGLNIDEFLGDAAATISADPIDTLELDMPADLVAGRVLFAALFLDDSSTAVDIAGWTQIGATEDYWYFSKLAASDAETASATWTGVSPAVGIVCQLDARVEIGDPIADFDYEATTAAAEITGLSLDRARYAVATLRNALADESAVEAAGWTLLAEGEAGTDPGGSSAMVQFKEGDKGGTVFDAAPTLGHALVAFTVHRGVAPGSHTHISKTTLSCAFDTSWTTVASDKITTDNDAVSAFVKLASSGDQGTWTTNDACGSDGARLFMFEFEGVGAADYQVLSTEEGTSSTINLGTFTLDDPTEDTLVMIVTFKSEPDPTVTATGWTEDYDGMLGGGTHPYTWVGHKKGSGTASVSQAGTREWTAIAIKLTPSSQYAAGSLVGKYIGRDDTVTSPFTGTGEEPDGVFAFNLISEAKPSLLIYGSDLLGTADSSGPSATHAWQPLFDSGSGAALIDSGTGNPITTFAPV